MAGLLLAAGEGRRMGGPKALVRFGDELLVERGLRLLREGGCEPVAVVLGAAADQVEARADLAGADVVCNPGWAGGMGSSLRVGLAALDAEAVVVALADQPLIGPEAIRRLIEAWRPARPQAAVATYEGAPRNPVLLDRRAWAAAAEAAVGDRGARAFLRGPYAARVLEVACDDTGSPVDVDTPDQLERARAAGTHLPHPRPGR